MSPRIIFNHTDGTRQTVSAIPMGVCSQQIDVVVEDGIIAKVAFSGGCSGNTQGLSALLQGMKVTDAIQRLQGIDCNYKGTSCPDQLAQVLKVMVGK